MSGLQGVGLDIARALALMLVFEGLLPFLAPARWREMMARMASFDDRILRTIGLLSMISGLVLLQML